MDVSASGETFDDSHQTSRAYTHSLTHAHTYSTQPPKKEKAAKIKWHAALHLPIQAPRTTARASGADQRRRAQRFTVDLNVSAWSRFLRTQVFAPDKFVGGVFVVRRWGELFVPV